jgi:hypothetical protein
MRLILLTILTSSYLASAQQPHKIFLPEDFSSEAIKNLSVQAGSNKKLPPGYEKQALIALSFYPELKNIGIEFRFEKLKSTLKAYPTLASSLFRSAAKRTYVVAICHDYSPGMEPIIFKNLPFNAQIGILGHELAHIADFVSKTKWNMTGVVLTNLSEKKTDKFEFKTDSIAIAHGLGWQLLDWSEFVRSTLKIQSYRGIQYYIKTKKKNKIPSDKEKYMNPATIRKFMMLNPIYSSSL